MYVEKLSFNMFCQLLNMYLSVNNLNVSSAGGPVGGEALPGAVPGRGLPVPRAVLLLPRHGARHQAVRHRAQERQR